MNPLRVQFRAQSLDYDNRIDIACADFENRTWYAEPVNIVITKADPEKPRAALEPLFSLSPEGAQSLLEALWSIGIRPKVIGPEDSRIAAISYHLQDMRRLVFKESYEK